MPVENPDQLHLRAAHGYIELGMLEAANAELEQIVIGLIFDIDHALQGVVRVSQQPMLELRDKISK